MKRAVRNAVAASFVILMSAAAVAGQCRPANAIAGGSSFGVAGVEGPFDVTLDGGKVVKMVPVDPPPVFRGCPVGMRANHLSDRNLVKAKGDGSSGVGQRLHLTLTGQGAHGIVSATLRVRGSSEKAVMESAAGAAACDALQMVKVHFSANSDGSVSADFRVRGLTAAREIELYAVTYSDGKTWKLPEGSGCSVNTDLMMLVDGK